MHAILHLVPSRRKYPFIGVVQRERSYQPAWMNKTRECSRVFHAVCPMISNQVLAIPRVYKGNVNTSLIKVGELFKEAVRENCPALVVVHNHPSGDPTPSPEDIKVTEQIVKAGKLLDIEVLDHLIIGQQRYISLKERGLGFPNT